MPNRPTGASARDPVGPIRPGWLAAMEPDAVLGMSRSCRLSRGGARNCSEKAHVATGGRPA